MTISKQTRPDHIFIIKYFGLLLIFLQAQKVTFAIGKKASTATNLMHTIVYHSTSAPPTDFSAELSVYPTQHVSRGYMSPAPVQVINFMATALVTRTSPNHRPTKPDQVLTTRALLRAETMASYSTSLKANRNAAVSTLWLTLGAMPVFISQQSRFSRIEGSVDPRKGIRQTHPCTVQHNPPP